MNGIDHFIQDFAVILAVAGLVGWACQRIGLSVVVGFLVAGIVVGPFTPPFSLVTDVGRIEALAQLGLVFLMFGIGLKLSVRKMRRLGVGLLFAVALSALLIYILTRPFGALVGWNPTESLFLAAMIMVSSSAIIGKVLQESGATHERAGQLAMGVTVVEDIVAVVMLTLLTSIVQFGGAVGGTELLGVAGRLLAFVVLAGIAGLLLLPWLLKKMSIAADEDLQTLGLAGLLFTLALVATFAGYSLALGAFLFGTIVAETPHRTQIERIFEGMRDVFSAVFFVAIGMQIDLRLLWSAAPLIVGVTLFTLVARGTAVTTGLALIGTPVREALRTGLTVMPIGEFSFIIAQLGVAAAVVPRQFYPLAVGLALLTTLVAPVLTRRSDRIADALLARQPRWLEAAWANYHAWLDRTQHRQSRSLIWQLSRKRVIQVSTGLMFVSGLAAISGQLLEMLRARLGRDWLFPNGLEVIFWVTLVLVVLMPLLAVWRNISAMAMLYAEVSTKGHPQEKKLRPVVETGLKIAAVAGLMLWLSAILPAEGTARWLPLLGLGVAAVALALLRRKFIYWHSEFEVEIQDMLMEDTKRMTATNAPWLRPHEEWKLHIADCVLPDLADCQGKSLRDLRLRSSHGCTVVGIERQGYMIPLPGPETVLYARDKVLLLGTVEQVKAGKEFLHAVSGAPTVQTVFDEVSMEAVAVPPGSRLAGRTLAEIAPAQRHGVLIAGVRRGGMRILNPSSAEVMHPGDEMLVLGSPLQSREFKRWLQEPLADETPS